MRNAIYRLCSVVFFVLISTISANAQDGIQVFRAQKPMPIDWMPDSLSTPRYTVAISPWVLMFNNGLKLDFEVELPCKGRWLQFSLMGYYAGKHADKDDKWESFHSSFDEYSALRGGGLAVFYKQMLTKRGWYLNAGAMMSYFDVGNYGTRFVSSVEDGLTYWRPKKALFYTKYYKPMIQMNVGKHVALSRHIFLDISTGLGYAYSIYDKDNHNGEYDGMYSFAYRGVEWNFGFRIGGLLGRSK